MLAIFAEPGSRGWICGTCQMPISAGSVCPHCYTVLCPTCAAGEHAIPAGNRAGSPCNPEGERRSTVEPANMIEPPVEPASSSVDPFDRWPAFIERIHARLEVGRRAYGDASFERPADELLDEIEAELLDVCGWSFVLYERIERLRQRVSCRR